MTAYVARCERPGRNAAGHTLTRYDAGGRPTSDTTGQLFCDQHKPPRTRIPHARPTTPLDALEQFERVLASEGAPFREAITENEISALEDYDAEIKRALAELRRALALWEPKPESKPKRKPLSLASDHPDQGDLADETRKRGEDAS
jgi:hypothetical protein